MLDDVTLALLGDRDAQERITARVELLPCQCGEAHPIIKKHSNRYSDWWLVSCPKCYISQTGKAYEFRFEAVEAWNTRAPILSAEELERLKYGNENEN